MPSSLDPDGRGVNRLFLASRDDEGGEQMLAAFVVCRVW
jgi:hypothetical protein